MDKAQLKVRLLKDIMYSLDDGDFDELLLHLDTPSGAISQGGKIRDKGLELIDYCDRRNTLPKLVAKLVELRPTLSPTYSHFLAVDTPHSAEPRPSTLPPAPPSTYQPTNPFLAGGMVTSKEMFYGRGEPLAEIQTRLANGGCYSVVGMRRIGKSSLLYQIAHFTRLADDPACLIAHLDLQAIDHKTLEGLITGIYTGWASKLPGYPFAEATLQGLNKVCQELSNQKYKPIVLLDEFECLMRQPDIFTNHLFENWRALANKRQLLFVTSSGKGLHELFEVNNLTSTFHNVFLQTQLGLFATSDAAALLQQPATRRGLPFPATEVDYLLELSGCHPFYLQMGGSVLFALLEQGRLDRARLRARFEAQARPCWQGLWDSLTAVEQEAVQWLPYATSPGLPVDMNYHWQKLADWGVLQRQGDLLKLFSQGFADWLKQEHPWQPPGHQPQATPEPEPAEPEPPRPSPTATATAVDLKALLAVALLTLLILIGVALVLRYILNTQDMLALVGVLILLFPFILVLLGRITGQDFMTWLRTFGSRGE